MCVTVPASLYLRAACSKVHDRGLQHRAQSPALACNRRLVRISVSDEFLRPSDFDICNTNHPVLMSKWTDMELCRHANSPLTLILSHEC